ncbi:hypothetical protein, partial [Pseudoroseomonas ludipueritiae]
MSSENLTLEQIALIEGDAHGLLTRNPNAEGMIGCEAILALCAMARRSLSDTSTAREGEKLEIPEMSWAEKNLLLAMEPGKGYRAANFARTAFIEEDLFSLEKLKLACFETDWRLTSVGEQVRAALAPSDPVSAGRDA